MTSTNSCAMILPLMAFFICTGFFTAFAADGNFSGTWSASGSKEVMTFGENREVALSKFSGHVNLVSSLGNRKDFWAECIGLEDTEEISVFRCSWKSLKGDKIFVKLNAQQQQEGTLVSGTMVGGTGEFTGISGVVEFKWSTLISQRKNDQVTVGGYAEGLKGKYTLP